MPHIDWWKREAAEQRARAEKAETETERIRLALGDARTRVADLEAYLQNEFPQVWERIEFNRRQEAREREART